MTGNDENNTTSSQHGHRFSKSPEELLNFSSLLSASPNQLFNARMKEHRFEYEMLLAKIKSRIGRARLVFEQSLKDHSRSNENELKNEFEQQVSDFVLESCDRVFLSEFGEQIYKLGTADKRLELIQEIFDSESKEEKQARAKSDLDSISRKSNKNEKFNTFLGRVRSLAELVSEFKDAQNFITNEAFKNAINPENRKFLKDHLKWNEPCETIAQFLDARDRYIQAPKVASVELRDQLADFMEKQNSSFMRNMAEIKCEMRSESEKDKSKFTDAINALTAQIAAIKTMAPRAPAYQQNRPNFGQQFQSPKFTPNFQNSGPRPRLTFQQSREQYLQNSGSTNFDVNRQNNQYCHFCRTPDHSRRYCPLITCHRCNKKGHKSFDCKEQENAQPAQRNFEPSTNPNFKDFVPQRPAVPSTPLDLN